MKLFAKPILIWSMTVLFFCVSCIIQKELKLSDIIEMHEESFGDHEAISTLQSLRVSGTLSEKDYTLNMEVRQMKEHFIHVKIKDHEGNSLYEEGYNGKVSWEKTSQDSTRRKTEGKPKRALHNSTLKIGPMVSFANYQQKTNGTIRYEGENELKGITYYVLLIDNGERETEYYINKQSNRGEITRSVYRHHAFQEIPQPIETFSSDFRKVDGIWFAFKSQERNYETGEILSTFLVKSIDVNPSFEVKSFGIDPGPS